MDYRGTNIQDTHLNKSFPQDKRHRSLISLKYKQIQIFLRIIKQIDNIQNQTIRFIKVLTPMLQQRIIKTDQSAPSSNPNQQNPQNVAIPNPLSPDLFLFQQIVIDMLNYCKRNLKVQPFDDMQVDKLVQGNKNQSIDIYQQYFLLGIGSIKTREFVCNKYEQLVRDNLINKENLPPQMITGVINARSVGPSGGGSTASSGSNVGSALNINIQKSLSIAKLINTIICSTIQPSSEISAGLVYILQATRNKNNGASFVQVMEDLYSNISKFRKKPIDRFITHFLNKIVSEVEYHESAYLEYQQKYQNQQKKYKNKQVQANYQKLPSIMREESNQAIEIPDAPPMFEYIRKQINYNSKEALCIHARDEQAKFGKCFICERGANNYDKVLFVPLCSMQCKNKLKRINQQCIMNDHFNFLKWILETLSTCKSATGNGDQILYSLLLREAVQTQKLTQQQIGTIMDIIVNNFSLQAIGITSIQSQLGNVIVGSKIIENCAMLMSHLIRKYPSVMFGNSKHQQNDQPLQQNIMKEGQEQQQHQVKISSTKPSFNNTKIIIIEMVRLLETLPVLSSSLQLTILKSLIQILSSKQYISQSKSYSYIVLRQLYINCDCKVLETNLVERIFNIMSQYALQGTNLNTSAKESAVSQNLGTNSSLSIQSSNSISMSMINNVNVNGSSGPEAAIFGLEQLLSSLVQTMNHFNQLQGRQNASDLIKQKKIKKYIESKFVQQFNKKPGKAVDKLRKLFNNKISAKDVAIILKQNMEYEYEIKVKKFRDYISRMEAGTYFGTLPKDKNKGDDFNQKVYWEFLHLLEIQYKGRQIDDCLRITFNAFNMPKEGQQVEVVLGPLSLVLQPFLGLKVGQQATATYQLIMVTLMVQTSNKPNVKQNEKLKLDGYKKFCSQFDQNLTQARITDIYNRMKQRPLQILMEYRGNQVFTIKYLSQELLKTDFWKNLEDLSVLEQKSESTIKGDQSIIKQTDKKENESVIIQGQEKKQQIKEEINQSRNSLQLDESRIFQNSVIVKTEESLLSFAMLSLWQYVYMSLVNKNNLRGLEHACVLYGNCELLTEYEAFFNHLYKIHHDLVQRNSSILQAISNQAKLIILKLAIDQSNHVIGRHSWLMIIKIIYKLDSQEDENIKPISKKSQNSYSYYEYEASDKLFTRTNTFKSERLKQFLQAMCQFSSSEVKTDKKYTRQMYILHHITQIIQYNLERFKGQKQEQKTIWSIVWPTIRSYFRNICIHPRKQISMSAIDSYKQLTMKMLKLDSWQINHTQLMNLYLYVFERSPAYIKDLIINILLNVVCREMKAGWNQLYTILEISDSQDKNVVMKVVARLIKDIGMEKIGNLLRLHQIIIKQLRISREEAYGDTMDRLWQVCQYFNRLDIWLQTLSKIKDIYKSTSNVQILLFLYKICNKCIQITHKQNREQKQAENNQNQNEIEAEQKIIALEEKIEERFMSQAYQASSPLKKQHQSPTQPQTSFIELDQVYRLVYFEVFSVQMHILEIKSTKLFVESINTFKQLDLDVFFKYLGNGGVGVSEDNKTGFLALWEMFLSSIHSVNFNYFLNEYLAIVFSYLSKLQKQLTTSKIIQNKKIIRSLDQLNNIKRQIFLWLIRIFLQTSKDQILQLCQQDSDLSKPFSQILQNQAFSSSKTELIEFYLSSKEYQARSIQHLVFLKIFKAAYQSGVIGGKAKDKQSVMDNSALEDLSKRILDSIIDSYQTASQVNDKPLLRNFLWNNEFFKGQDYLPGLMKQQLRSFELIVKYFDVKQMDGKLCKIILNFIKKFSYKASLVWKNFNKQKLKQSNKNKEQKTQINIKPEEVQQNDANQRLTQILYQDLGLWITNSQQIAALTLRKLSLQIKQYEEKENKMSHEYFEYKKLFEMCMELSKFAASPLVLKQISSVLQELVLKMF